jgi:hypothetical protein
VKTWGGRGRLHGAHRGRSWAALILSIAGMTPPPRPFIGSRRRRGGRLGSDGGGGALSRWWPVMEGKAKRRRCRLMEGKGGGG